MSFASVTCFFLVCNVADTGSLASWLFFGKLFCAATLIGFEEKRCRKDLLLADEIMLVGDEISGVVAKVIRKHDNNAAIGLLLDAGLPAFVPRSQMLDEYVAQIDGLIGCRVDGVVQIVDEKRRTVVITPTRFQKLGPAKPTDSYLTDEYLLLLVDNLRAEPNDNERYLGRESARNILVAIYSHDVGSDPDAWQQYISERRTI